MKYILIAESLVLVLFLCRLLNALTNRINLTEEKKPFKIDLRAPFKSGNITETEEERKARLLLENIENYGTPIAQQEVK